MNPLTKEQADFAAEHHDLIYRFLNYKRYPEDDFYDIAVFGYLKAVSLYHEREDLREYSFSTIAFKRMQYEVFDYFCALNRPMRKADVRQYDEDSDLPVYGGNFRAEPERCLEAQETREAIFQVLSPTQNQVIRLRTEGFNTCEIGVRLKMRPRQIKQELSAAGTAIYELVPELYGVAA